MSRALLVYQPQVAGAQALAEQCAKVAEHRGFEPSLISLWDLAGPVPADGETFAVTFGGDGTILSVARWVAGLDVRVIGVQMGRLGFMAELQPAEAVARLDGYLGGDYWVDRRSMLRADIVRSAFASAGGIASSAHEVPSNLGRSFLALNDIVVGRGQALRTVSVDVVLNGESLHQFRADGVIVATATGSTAYSFASGGPVLAPDSEDLVVTPVAPHLSTLRSFVLPGDVPLRLEVRSTELPQLSIDGQIDLGLPEIEAVEAQVDRAVTLFARQGTPEGLYRRILSKLG
jgi:NAD+ kinase